jgi:hypothetical protein
VHQFPPLALRWHRPSRDLVAHAIDEVLLIECQPLGPRDVLDVAWRLASVAYGANRNQPIGIIGIVSFGAQRQRRTMIEDDLAQYHSRSAIEAASLLPQHNLRSEQGRGCLSFASSEGGPALHRKHAFSSRVAKADRRAATATC